jgi:integrase
VTAPAAAPASGPTAPPALRAAPQPAAGHFAFAAVLDSLPRAPAKAGAATADKQAHPSGEPQQDRSLSGQPANHSLMSDGALLASLPFALQAASMTAERSESPGAPSSLPTAAPKGPESEGADASLAANAKAPSVGRLIGERAFHFASSALTSASAGRGPATDAPFMPAASSAMGSGLSPLAGLGSEGELAAEGGLYLSISGEGRRRWVFMYVLRGKQREAALGSAGKGGVPLKAAREKAAQGRALLKAGVDPIAEWSKPLANEAPTFGEAADDFLEAHAGGWRNEKHKTQWRMTLTRYCEPIRHTSVDAIDTEAVLSVLKPLWARAPETASHLRGRIELVLDAARARGHIGHNEANPARWRGHLDKLLPKRAKLTRGHHAAMPYADIPAFVAGLRERRAIAARALEFCILTAARSGEALAARWDEVNFEAKVWAVPPERTKVGREHRIPLSDRALALLREMEAARAGDYAFPGQRPGRPLSAMRFKSCCGGSIRPTRRTASDRAFGTGRRPRQRAVQSRGLRRQLRPATACRRARRRARRG